RHRRCRLDRGPALLPGVAHDPAGRLDDQIHAGVLRERAARPEGGDRAVDQARGLGVGGLPARPVAGPPGRAGVLRPGVGAAPAGRMSRVRPRLWGWRPGRWSPPISGGRRPVRSAYRMLSPRPGFSILITSAPRSPSSDVHHGPAAWWLRSITRIPESAPGG